MPNKASWEPLTPDLNTVFSLTDQPLQALADLEIPAVVLRRAYDPTLCRVLIQRFVGMGLMRDPVAPIPMDREDKRRRIDIGTSLGNRGHDKEAFFLHAVETHRLFRFLFEGFENPVDVIYHALQRLASGKRVQTATEANGRLYGPAIFRIHYEGQFYRPHIDHVLVREKRLGFSVSRFDHQFAGILCLQNASHSGRSPQGILHRCGWTPKVQPHLEAGSFHDYAAENKIENCRVELAPGDLYFFNSGGVHEVSQIAGDQPRIVLAVFIGYSPDEDNIYVWS